MRRKHYSKSALFLVELLINILLFSFLCGCGLLFFMKSQTLTKDATDLHNGVRITSSLAALYESGDGSFDIILANYDGVSSKNDSLTLYFDGNYASCHEAEAVYEVHIQHPEGTFRKAQIDFCSRDEQVIYSIRACCLSPASLKEVTNP